MSQPSTFTANHWDASPPRVLITKIGLDGHDRGSRIVAAYLRDAGMEVIYTPPWQEIQSVVQLALQEDVDLIGVSSLATDHLIIPDHDGGLARGRSRCGGGIYRRRHSRAGASHAVAGGSSRHIWIWRSQRDEIVECAQETGSTSSR